MYYDLLAKLKNATVAKKEYVQTPFSQMDFAVAKILLRYRYIRDVQKKIINRKSFLEIRLSFRNRKPALTGFHFVSKPGRRVYVGYRDLRPVKQNTGIAVLSTPEGIMTNREARRRKAGGEYLFEVW